MRFETEARNIDALAAEYDQMVADDGINSRVRPHYADHLKPDIDTRACKFVWLGAHAKFYNAFTFIFQKTRHGWVWAHAYQFDTDTATIIVECAQDTWEAWGRLIAVASTAALKGYPYVSAYAAAKHGVSG